ncbi:MAG: beta-lactamase family protein [Planctomycetes bacterium]|nr:beta-lactamase family protein [Planctomycetota bacterium]
MRRRTFLQCGLATAFATPLFAALRQKRLDEAAAVLAKVTSSGQVKSAVMFVSQGTASFTQHFGQAKSEHAMFLLGSISKPICVTALMTLYDQKKFGLDDPVKKYLPQFQGDGRDQVTLRHLLTHVSGLPDQLAENARLRASHAGLPDFVQGAIRTPLLFEPGTRYQYSSMAILLATHVAELVSGIGILELVDRTVFQPLGLKYSAQGLGRFAIGDMVRCQTEHAAPESGAGDPNATSWDWNSPYWRKLGAPWGGTHCSAPDIGRVLAEFLFEKGKVVKPTTARLMTTNQNPPNLTARGLGFNVGASAGSPGCSEKAFGHTGSTGTIAWADPATETICVVLTSLPARALSPHPRDLAANRIAAAD